MADVVCLRGLRCRRNSARRAAGLRFSAALLHGGLGRAGARAPGARCSSTAAKARSAEVRGPVFAVAVPAPQRRVGDADASAEERPGAALARADAGSRSAAREHRRRVRRRVRERRDQALQRPRGARTARPRRCPPNLLGGRARRSERSASGGDAPEARGACAQRSGALHVSRRQPNDAIGLRGATRRVPEGGPRRGPWHAPCGAPVPFLAPRAGADVGAFRSTAPAGAVRAPLRAVSSWTRTTGSRAGIALTSARSGSTRTTTPRTSTKGRRLRLRAEGRWSCRSSRVAPAGAPAPRRHAP